MVQIVRPGDAIRVTVVSHTTEPLRTIALAQKNMTGHMLHNVNDISRGDAFEIFNDICKTELQGAFEFVHFVIQMEGVSRAFQQQLTRTRLAAYSAESLRFTESGMQVLMGPHLSASDDAYAMQAYVRACEVIENTYTELIHAGIPTEDARGILPLNVLSKIGMCVSYKTLIQMSRVRMCYQSQPGEWDTVFRQIVSGIERIEPILIKPFGPFCEHGQKCPFGSILDRDCPRKA